MKKICFIETSHDQRDLISLLVKHAKNKNLGFVLLVNNNKLKQIYSDLVDEIHVCKTSFKYDSFSSLKAYLFEKRTRFFPFRVKPVKEKKLEETLCKISPNIVLTYVGPESIKYLASKLEKKNKYQFYFMDQIQNGLRTLTKTPFSVSGCYLNNVGKESDHVPHIGRPRKKKLKHLILLKYDFLRYLEAIISTINRKIKMLFFTLFFKQSKTKTKNEVILAPQGYTEASFTYCTYSFDSSVKQLFLWSQKNPNYNYRWRLHKHSYLRMEWMDFIYIYKSGYKIEDFICPLFDSIKQCKFVTTVSSNIVFDSSLLGTPSIVLGKSVYHNNRIYPYVLSDEKISFHNSLIGFEDMEWTDYSAEKLMNFLNVN